MSKFSKLVEQMYLPLGIVLEQEETMEIDPTVAEQEASSIEDKVSSEIPILSNDEIANFIANLKQFFSQENPELTKDQIEQIKNVNPRDSREDASIKASIDVLMKIFNVAAVQTAPSTVPNSDYSE
jgi:hypothetical protein